MGVGEGFLLVGGVGLCGKGRGEERRGVRVGLESGVGEESEGSGVGG